MTKELAGGSQSRLPRLLVFLRAIVLHPRPTLLAQRRASVGVLLTLQEVLALNAEDFWVWSELVSRSYAHIWLRRTRPILRAAIGLHSLVSWLHSGDASPALDYLARLWYVL